MLLLRLLSCLLVAFGPAAGAFRPRPPGSPGSTVPALPGPPTEDAPEAIDERIQGEEELIDPEEEATTTTTTVAPVFDLPTLATGPIIDYSSCGKEAVCGVRASCLRDGKHKINHTMYADNKTFPSGKATLVFLSLGDNRWSVKDNCSVGIWIKPLSELTWIVKMQVRTDPSCFKDPSNPCTSEARRQRIDPVKGMELHHNGITRFGCRHDANKTIVALGGKDVELYQFEKSRLQPEDCYCSFLIRNADKIAKLPAGKTFMQFVLTTGVYDMAESNGFENVAKSRQCNVFTAKATPSKTFDNFVKLRIKDLLSPSLNCNPEKYEKLYAALPGQVAEPVKNVTCKLDTTGGTNNYIYEIEPAVGAPRKVPKDADFPAFCAVPVNTYCKEPVYRGNPQPEFIQYKASGNVTITCPNDKWLINKKFYFTGVPECKNSLKRPNNASWFVTIDNKDIEIESVECTEDLNCKVSTNYTNDCPPEHKNACAKLLTIDGLRCPVEYTLIVVQLDGEKFQAEIIECDQKKGVWTNSVNMTELDRDANVYCEPHPVEEESKVDEKTLKAISYGAIGAVIFSLFVFVVQEIVSEYNWKRVRSKPDQISA